MLIWHITAPRVEAEFTDNLITNAYIRISTSCLATQSSATWTPTYHVCFTHTHTQIQKAKQTPAPFSLQSPLLQPVNGGINMFEWRESLSFVGVEGSVISCLGSQEAGASILLCVCVCVCMRACVCVSMRASVWACACVWDVHQGEGHELKQTKRSWIILFKRLPVLVIHTFSTWCSCTSAPVACSWDQQLPLSRCLTPLWPPRSVTTQSQHSHIHCVLSFLKRGRAHNSSVGQSCRHTWHRKRGFTQQVTWVTQCHHIISDRRMSCISVHMQRTNEFPQYLEVNEVQMCPTCKTLCCYTPPVAGLWCGTWSALRGRITGTGILWLFPQIYLDFIIVIAIMLE